MLYYILLSCMNIRFLTIFIRGEKGMQYVHLRVVLCVYSKFIIAQGVV